MTSAAIPPRMRRGDKLGVVAPAGPADRDKLARGLARLGDAFELVLAPSLTAPRRADAPSYLAAADDVRRDELHAMLADRDIRGILVARGGYGLMRILPQLDGSLLRHDPIPIVGFSDATALLGWAHAAGVRGIHGPVGTQLADLDAGDLAQLIALLTEPVAPGERPWSLVAHGSGRHRGPLIAANLTLASLLAGTPWALPLRGAIAVLEEVGERPYEIDRYLTHLALTGALPTLSAAVIGELVRCADPAPPAGGSDPGDAALRVVLERLAASGCPAASGAPVGHGTRNEPLPFGAACDLDLDRGVLAILEPAVA